MPNPWLDIPLADYEAHMALPATGQARLIADELEILVRAHSPSQLPHDTMAHVSPSPYSSLRLLAPGMQLVSQEELQRQASLVGFAPERSRMAVSTGGKRFCINEFRLGMPSPPAEVQSEPRHTKS